MTKRQLRNDVLDAFALWGTIVGINLIFGGCATVSVPALETLMRASYEVGCSERALKDVPAPKIKHDPEVKKSLAECEKKAQSFNPYQTGIYRHDFELVIKETHLREKP